ncbi:MAG TPA: hypothetical protein VFF27_19020 [Bacteroidia bacterium]|jgi:hypothetical protein|nr:hypothetical protein [Bacteroidia bacterium]
MIEEFKDISIRGRLAYGATCLEEALHQLGIRDEYLDKLVLPRIWEFTSSSRLDEWDTQINEIDPTCVLDIELTEKTFDLTTISFNDYKALFKCYQSLHKEIVELISEVIGIGVANLYGGTEDFSACTLESLANVIEICNKMKLKMPNVEPFRKSSFSEFHGWGKERPRESFSITKC